ncbi:cystatin domain-containing protein [Limnohabitans sp. Rim8]|uniref:cystatin domain-containing protein n=1 Tax=Limnohabitans sp. Rim8 TaxID=1100718 RepID=UPI0033058672
MQINDTLKMQAGGWTQADNFNEDVQEAARFAVQKQAVLTQSRLIYKDVLSAQTQIIAGLNFQLKVSVTEQDLPRYARVTVWRNLQNQYSLTQWVWTND